jgi:hypothetical protein
VPLSQVANHPDHPNTLPPSRVTTLKNYDHIFMHPPPRVCAEWVNTAHLRTKHPTKKPVVVTGISVVIAQRT